MKRLRFLLSLVILAIAGCATSLAPNTGFNDWTNTAAYPHYQTVGR